MKISRRDFLRSTLGIIPPLFFEKNFLPQRQKYLYLDGIPYKLSAFGIGSTKPLTPEIIEYAIDSGINLVDTANIYQGGRSERIIGQLMKRKRDKVFLITKLDPKTWKSEEKRRLSTKVLKFP